jgi:hypothetical protein
MESRLCSQPMKFYIASLLLLLVTLMAPNTRAQHRAIGTLAADAPQSLLTGCTVPKQDNVVSCPAGLAYPPPGWTQVCAEGFEGSLASNEVLQPPSAIVTTQAHAGTHSLYSNMVGDGSVVDIYCEGATSATGEFYLSGWDYVSSPGVFGIDWELGRFHTNLPSTGNSGVQKCAFGPQPSGPSYLPLSAPAWVGCESSCFEASCNPRGTEFGDFDHATGMTINIGTWRQYEWYFKANTCVGNRPKADGSYSYFINGKLVAHHTAVNLIGCANWTNQPVTAEFPGIMTVLWYGNAAGTKCYPLGSAYPSRYMAWRANWYPTSTDGSRNVPTPLMTTDGVSPCWGSQRSFGRWADDFIVLRK